MEDDEDDDSDDLVGVDDDVEGRREGEEEVAELDDELGLVGKLAVPGKDDSSLSSESPDDVVGLEDVDGSLGGVADHQHDHHTRQQGRHSTVASGRSR